MLLKNYILKPNDVGSPNGPMRRIMTVVMAILASVSGYGDDRRVMSADTAFQPVQKIESLISTPHRHFQRRKVRVRATVSSVGKGILAKGKLSRAYSSFCIEDDTAGIWVRTRKSLTEELLEDAATVLPKIKYGCVLNLEGYLEQGAFAPVILPTRIEVVDQQELPPAEHPDIKVFLNGGCVVQRVVVSGVVQNMVEELGQGWLMRVETGVGHFLCRTPKTKRFSPEKMLNARIEVTGVAGVSRNWRAQFVCPRVIIDRPQDIRIVVKPSSDPFSDEEISLDLIDRYLPQGRPLHRILTQGTVTYYDGLETMYVQDDGIGVRVQTDQIAEVEVGDRVKVSGFVDTSKYNRGLRGAWIRNSKNKATVQPVSTTITQIIDDHFKVPAWGQMMTKTFDGRLVRLQGRLLSYQKATSREPNRLEIDCGDSISTVFLPSKMKQLPIGTVVELTGVATLTYATDKTRFKPSIPVRVDLLLRDPSTDIEILALPSWWTAQRIGIALVAVLGFALIATSWAFMLNRTVRKQTRLISAQIRQRRDAAIEFQAAFRERTRLASDLHDTVLQTMAGVAYQIEACERNNLNEVCDPNHNNHLGIAGRMIQRGQEDLRNVVWALNYLPQNEGLFVDSVRKAANRIVHGDQSVVINCDKDLPPLADFVGGNLLLVVQEAIHNAVKHADATQIKINLQWRSWDHQVVVTVRDNGCGFDVQSPSNSREGHFGIEGMLLRIERLAGKLDIASDDTGTTVTVAVPLREFDADIA